MRVLKLSAAAILLAALTVTAVPLPAGGTSDGAKHMRVKGDTYRIAARLAGGTCDSKPGSRNVVIASGEEWHHALAATALDRPLLFTRRTFLPAVTKDYLRPCGDHPKAKAIVLGGTKSVSNSVVSALKKMGYTVQRIAGKDRYETARKVSKQFAPKKLDNVYLAAGDQPAYAVAAGPHVAKNSPLILTKGDKLHPQAKQFLSDDKFKIRKVVVLGGTKVVSDEVVDEIKALGLSTRRLGGEDVYETAVKLAGDSLARGSCAPLRDVAVASDSVPYPGLAAGAMRDRCEPLLLAPKQGQPVPEPLVEFGKDWLLAVGSHEGATITAVGSVKLVPGSTLQKIVGSSTSGGGSGGSSDGALAKHWSDVAKSIVLVECRNSSNNGVGWGSGFVVGNGRQIVTNHHVITFTNGKACNSVHVWTKGDFDKGPSSSIKAKVVRSSQPRDLALLSIPKSKPKLRKVTITTRKLKPGEQITALGYPGVGGESMTLTTGSYSGSITHEGYKWLKTDAQVSPGNSGGGAFDTRHKLLGVPTAVNTAEFSGGDKLRGLSLLIPASDVKELLKGDIGVKGTDKTGSGSGSSGGGGSTSGDGEWGRYYFTNNKPYIALFGDASATTFKSPYDHYAPVAIVSCDNYVEIDFWSSLLQMWGGPYIGGTYRIGDRVPVTYGFGEGNYIHANWHETKNNTGLLASGNVGKRFISKVRNSSGHLGMAYTNFDGKTESFVFPRVKGIKNALKHLNKC